MIGARSLRGMGGLRSAYPCCTVSQISDPTMSFSGLIMLDSTGAPVCDSSCSSGISNPCQYAANPAACLSGGSSSSATSTTNWTGPLVGIAVAGIIILTLKGF